MARKKGRKKEGRRHASKKKVKHPRLMSGRKSGKAVRGSVKKEPRKSRTVSKAVAKRTRRSRKSQQKGPVTKNKGRKSDKIVAAGKANHPIKEKNYKVQPFPEKKETVRRRFRLTEKKLNHLIQVGNLEEFYFLMSMLNDKEILKFLEHYKKKHHHVKEKNKDIDLILQNTNTVNELLEKLKQKLATSLNDEVETIRAKISEARKKGADMQLEEIKVLNLPAKIRLFEATYEKKDYYNVKKYLHEIEELIKTDVPKEENNKEGMVKKIVKKVTG